MILKALNDYYHRDKNSIPFGWKRANLSFIIVIDETGRFVRVEDCRNEKGEGTSFILPKGEHTNSETPLLFWDNMLYALDYSGTPTKKTHEKHISFVKRCKDVAARHENKALRAVAAFYEMDELKKVYQDALWNDMIKNPNNNVSFRIQGALHIIPCEDYFESIVQHENDKDDANSVSGICMVTGKKGKLVKIGTPTPIIGCKSSAKLVAFQKSSGYDSYGKEQGYNAPVSVEADFAFSTAIKKLLENNSKRVGNRSFLFWASSNGDVCEQVEENVFTFLGFADYEDNPNRNIEQVKKLFASIYSGELKTSLDDKFYILGLAPNSARIAVTYWSEMSLKEFAAQILRHFDDMDIVDTRKEPKPYMGLRSILSAVTLGGKSSDATPNLPEAVVKSIFQGLPYPYTLFAGCIRRIRAEQSLNITRASILKAYLNRTNNNQQKIDKKMDKENTNQGYLCGRLFAVLDKIQDDANKQHSIRERYMNAASSTPAAVFATILNLSSHHSEKLNEGRKIFFEKTKQEIIDKISANGFPAHLDLQDQGRFFVGYYHQMQAFYTKNEEEQISE